MNFIKKYLAARARKRYEDRKNCEEGNHVWGRWRTILFDTYQRRVCRVCGYREEEKLY